MENIFFLVLVAIVGLARLAFQVAEKNKTSEAQKRASTPPGNAPPLRTPAESEEERVRKFFEALGVPASSSPPSQARGQSAHRQTERPKRKVIMPVDPFPSTRRSLPPLVTRPSTASTPPPSPAPPEPSTSSIPVQKSARPAAKAERAAPEFEVRDFHTATAEDWAVPALPLVVPTPSQAETSFAARLAGQAGLREAVILREILGPPRSMQALR